MFSVSIETIISTAWNVSVTITAANPPATVKLVKITARAIKHVHSG